MSATDPTNYLRECVRIEPMALEEEFVRVPSDLAYWNEEYSKIYQFWLERKMIREQVQAMVQTECRERLEATKKGGKPTVGEVENEMLLDTRYQQAKSKEIQAESEKVRLAGVLDALRSKRDMLISLGAHMRAEMQNDPMIRRTAAVDREVRNAQEHGG